MSVPTVARRLIVPAAMLALYAFPFSSLAAQEKQPPAKQPPAMDHSKMDHGAMTGAKAGAWKELEAYHVLMMAVWHAARDKDNLVPTRAMVAQMVTAAKAVATSKAPASCQKPELTKAQASLPAETDKVAALVTSKATDAALKAALSTLHEKFEVLQHGCGGEMKR